MLWLGMCTLGIYVGYVTTFALVRIKDWSKPASALSAVLSAAVGGGIFTFIQHFGADATALSLYPVGLAYGALCTNLRWLTEQRNVGLVARLHLFAFIAATIALLMIFLIPGFRDVLPK